MDTRVARLEAAITDLEKARGDVADPGRLVEALVPLERRLAAVRSGLAAEAAEQRVHRRSGHADEVQWLARTTGVSRKTAKDQLDTEKRLADLPVLREARQTGELSDAQANLVARAAEADPSRQRRLVGTARREDLKGLKNECDRVIAGADDDQAATHARIKKDRSVRFWSEPGGTHCLLAKGTADDLAVVRSRINKQRDAIFAQARREGRRESTEAYDFDALLHLVRRNPASAEKQDDQALPDARPPKRDVLIHIDWSAARRGYTVAGERCEIEGIGPVPVEVAMDFDADPFIKAVIRDGTDVRTVAHYGRHVPAEMRTALEARGRVCCVPGCSNTGYLDIDHAVVDHAKGGPLALWNTQWLCKHHHRLKTSGELDIELPPPTPPPMRTEAPELIQRE